MNKKTTTKSLQVFFAVIFSILTAGIVFGYASLKNVLIREGVYLWLCPTTDQCPQQKYRLDLMFTIASSFVNIGSLPVGFILDRIGPKKTGIIGSVLLLSGHLLFALSNKYMDAYIPAFVLIAFGGPFVFNSTVNITLAFPQRAGLVMGLLTGGFDGSSIVYYILDKLNSISGGVISSSLFEFGYCGVAVLVFVVFITIMPSTTYAHNSETDVTSKSLEFNQSMAIHNSSVGQQCKRIEFWLVTIVTGVFMIRLNYFISTIKDQMLFKVEEQANELVEMFGLILPLCGAAAVPFVGLLLSHSSDIVYFVVVSMGLMWGIMSFVPIYAVQLSALILFSFFRVVMYGVANSFFALILYGLFNTINGMVSLIVLPLLVGVDDLQSLNIGLTVLSSGMFVLPVWLYRKKLAFRLEQQSAEMEMDEIEMLKG